MGTGAKARVVESTNTSLLPHFQRPTWVTGEKTDNFNQINWKSGDRREGKMGGYINRQTNGDWDRDRRERDGGVNK